MTGGPVETRKLKLFAEVFLDLAVDALVGRQAVAGVQVVAVRT